MVIVFLFTCIPVQAGEEGVVTGSVVNIRKGPGTSYGVVTKTKAGQQFAVLEDSGGWLRVRLHNGTEGWISKDYVNVMSAEYVMVTVNVLNVRSGPGTNYAIVTKIGLNELRAVVARQGGWYKIQVGDLQGWVSGEYVRPTDPPPQTGPPVPAQPPAPAASDVVAVTGSVVNIRHQPGENAPVVAKVYSGDRLAVTARQGDWLQIRLSDGKTGWIAAWLTEPASGEASSRGYIQEAEVLIAPIAAGKTFKVIDSGGRPMLKLEGWANTEYKTRTTGTNTLVLELNGRTERNYQGKISRLGISAIKIYPQADKCIIELTFAYAPTQSIVYDSASKMTRIQVGAVQTQGLSGKVIVVDPGHASVQPGGWLDPGAIGKKTGIKEKDINLSIALKLKSLLEQAGARVIMTHTGQTELSLADRAWLANSNNADIFVSIHSNYNQGNKVQGHTTYYYAPASDPTLNAQRYSRQKLANLVQRELVKAAGRNDMGVLQGSYAVLRETRVPSILVEAAFLSDPTEESLLGTDAFRQKVAAGIFNGIRAYFQ